MVMMPDQDECNFTRLCSTAYWEFRASKRPDAETLFRARIEEIVRRAMEMTARHEEGNSGGDDLYTTERRRCIFG